MRKYICLFLLSVIFMISCKGNQSGEGIIDQRRMTSLLTDVIVIDGSMYNILQTPDTLYKYGTDHYLKLFKKYQTDSVQFNRSFKYYTSKPVQLQAICDQVLENLKIKSDSLNKLQQKIHVVSKK